MKILVSAKRVTDPDARIRLKPDLSGIDLEGVEYKLNPFCENAIEEALRLQSAYGGEVIAFMVGTSEAEGDLRKAMAMGAARGIRVDAKDEDLDSDLVARIVVKLYEKEKPDLILLGKQAIDGDSNQVSQLVAEYLGIASATNVSHPEGSAGMQSDKPGMKLEGNKLFAMREVDGGSEVLEMELPAIASADLRLNEPRLPKLPMILAAKRKPLEALSLADLGVQNTVRVKTVALASPPVRKAGIKVKSVQELVDKLADEARVL